MTTYTIIDSADLENLNFDELLTTSSETARKSIDGTKAVINWDGEVPESVSAIDTGPHLTAAEMREVLNDPDWIHPDPFHMEQ